MMVGESALASVAQVVEDLARETLRANDAEARAKRAEEHARATEVRAERAEGLLRQLSATVHGFSIEAAPTLPAGETSGLAISTTPEKLHAPTVAATRPADRSIMAHPPIATSARKSTVTKRLPRAKAAFGLGLPPRDEASSDRVKQVNPETKATLLAAVRGQPGKTWREYANDIGVPPSPFFSKACNELRAEGACRVEGQQVFAA